jgi:hypothetical protein
MSERTRDPFARLDEILALYEAEQNRLWRVVALTRRIRERWQALLDLPETTRREKRILKQLVGLYDEQYKLEIWQAQKHFCEFYLALTKGLGRSTDYES